MFRFFSLPRDVIIKLAAGVGRIAGVVSRSIRSMVGGIWRVVCASPLTRLFAWLKLRLLVFRRAWRSRRSIHRARRHLQLEMAAMAHGRSDSRPSNRGWASLATVLIFLNVLLLVLWVRDTIPFRHPVAAEVKSSPLPSPQMLPSPTPEPTVTKRPTMIPVNPAPTPHTEVEGGSVVFVARENGNDDLFMLTGSGNQPIRLTDNRADDRDPAWSPNGRHVAFSSHRDGNWELYLLDLVTGVVKRLTWDVAYEGNPAWSPDGHWLAYESYRNENFDIFIMEISGGNVIRLTAHPEADYGPAWAPSGRHIAFISWRSGDADIFLFPLDDARDEAVINISRSPEVEEDNPSWHPGGEFLAYSGRSGDRELVYAQPMANNLPTNEPFAVAQGHEATWSPNGRSLLYVHDEGEKHYLLASAVDGWGAAPEVFLDDRPLRSPDWHLAVLPPGMRFADTSAPDAPPLFVERVADPADSGPPYGLVEIEGLEVPGPFLSDRVDDSFRALRQRVEEVAGWDFLQVLDQMWEPLDSEPPPAMNGTSWAKSGRAFDVVSDFNAGVHPILEVVREPAGFDTVTQVCTGAETQWRLFIRAQRQDGSQGEPLRTRPWNLQLRYSGNAPDYEAGGRPRETIPPGYYVDFTQMAADYGWERVVSGPTWRTYYPAILFWRFEKREELSWEAAMLEIYTEKELKEVLGGREP